MRCWQSINYIAHLCILAIVILDCKPHHFTTNRISSMLIYTVYKRILTKTVFHWSDKIIGRVPQATVLGNKLFNKYLISSSHPNFIIPFKSFSNNFWMFFAVSYPRIIYPEFYFILNSEITYAKMTSKSQYIMYAAINQKDNNRELTIHILHSPSSRQLDSFSCLLSTVFRGAVRP